LVAFLLIAFALEWNYRNCSTRKRGPVMTHKQVSFFIPLLLCTTLLVLTAARAQPTRDRAGQRATPAAPNGRQ
jgi:hypothetical protein